MHGWGARTRLVVGTLVVGALIASACGSGSTAAGHGTFRVAAIARSMDDAGTARFAGSMRVAVPHMPVDPTDTTFVGTIDFTHNSSTWDGRGTSSDGKPFVAHSRTVGGYEYSEIPTDTSSHSAKPWTRLTALTGGGFIGNSNVADVSGLVQQLEHAGGRPELIGSETVRGVPTDHYQLEFAPRAVPQQLIAMGQMRKPSGATIDIWADADNRLRRIRQRTEGTPDHFDAEYFDFGTPVAIAPPPEDQVEDDATANLSGDWTESRSGRAGSVAWQVYRAPTPHGACFAHEATPPGPFDGLLPKQRGRSIDLCATGLDSSFESNDLNVTATELANGRALLFGGSAPDVTRLKLHDDGGRSQVVVPQLGTFAVALAPDEVVRTIDTESPSGNGTCRLEDSLPGYNCFGPGRGPKVPPDPTFDTTPTASAPPSR